MATETTLADDLAQENDPERVFAMLEKWAPRILKLVGFRDEHRLALTDVILGVARKVDEINDRALVSEASAKRTETLVRELARRAGIDPDAPSLGVP